MNKRCFYQFIRAISVLTILGCAANPGIDHDKYRSKDPTYTWHSKPLIQVLTKKDYDIEISPYGCSASYYYHVNGCSGIFLSITNKTDKDILRRKEMDQRILQGS